MCKHSHQNVMCFSRTWGNLLEFVFPEIECEHPGFSVFCWCNLTLETLLFETFIQLMDGTLLWSFNGYLLSWLVVSFFSWICAVGYFFTAHSHNISPSSIYIYIYLCIPTNPSCKTMSVRPSCALSFFCFGRYIDYNVKKLAKPGSIARHTDNDSMVTMVVSWLPWKKIYSHGSDRFSSTYWDHIWEVMRCQR